MTSVSRRRSRWTLKNVGKAIAAFMFSALLPYYVLILGLVAKKKKVIAEGALYAIAFTAAVSAPSSFDAFAPFLVVGSYIGSGVRMYQLRDLWLPAATTNPLCNRPKRLGRRSRPPGIRALPPSPRPRPHRHRSPLRLDFQVTSQDLWNGFLRLPSGISSVFRPRRTFLCWRFLRSWGL